MTYYHKNRHALQYFIACVPLRTGCHKWWSMVIGVGVKIECLSHLCSIGRRGCARASAARYAQDRGRCVPTRARPDRKLSRQIFAIPAAATTATPKSAIKIKDIQNTVFKPARSRIGVAFCVSLLLIPYDA